MSNKNQSFDPQGTFRDSIGTIDKEGKRSWVFPKKPSGVYYKYRKWVSYFLILFLFSAPFIKVKGNQFLLFNVLDRKFNIFGFPFWPQDFYLVVISMIVGVVFVTLFTVAFGRIFCGWICPQTIFMEMVFRRIEYWIEGDRNKQIRLSKQPWNAEKIRKRLTKWIVFFIVSFIISNVFLAYLKGSDQVIEFITHSPMKNLKIFITLLIFTAVFYFVFTWFREQACIIACPYGRLQGVLLDNQSVVVAYDYVRGESKKGRARYRKNENRVEAGKGDCIDCKLCVHVCPTGIDIRNGTQLECVNCTACIDECDSVMERIGFKKGLIRYASVDNIEKNQPFKFSLRMKGYSVVLTILISVLVGMLFLRNDVEATILRLPGQLFQHKENGVIRNAYSFKVINKTTEEIKDVSYKLISHKGKIKNVTSRNFDVPKQGLAEGSIFIDLHKSQLDRDKMKIKVGVYSGDKLIETTTTNFLGPRTFH